MVAEMLVWAFDPNVPEVNGQGGYVALECELALQLIADGKVQDPAVGALHLKDILPVTPPAPEPAPAPPPA